MKPYYTDKWVTIYHGDCREILPQLDVKVDLVLTDPPYLFNRRHGGNTEGEKSKFANSELYKESSEMLATLGAFGKEQIVNSFNIIKCNLPKMHIFVFASEEQVVHYLVWAEVNHYKYNILIWQKPLSIINKGRYSMNIEYLLRIYTDGCPLNKDCSNLNYSRIKTYKVDSKTHPTQKPLALIEELISTNSGMGQLILDPFLGSGTTALAAKKLNRKCIGIEIEEKYCEISAKRCSQEVMELGI